MPAPEGHILIYNYFTTLFVTTMPVLPRLTGRACFLKAADSSYSLNARVSQAAIHLLLATALVLLAGI